MTCHVEIMLAPFIEILIAPCTECIPARATATSRCGPCPCHRFPFFLSIRPVHRLVIVVRRCKAPGDSLECHAVLLRPENAGDRPGANFCRASRREGQLAGGGRPEREDSSLAVAPLNQQKMGWCRMVALAPLLIAVAGVVAAEGMRATADFHDVGASEDAPTPHRQEKEWRLLSQELWEEGG